VIPCTDNASKLSDKIVKILMFRSSLINYIRNSGVNPENVFNKLPIREWNTRMSGMMIPKIFYLSNDYPNSL
jgi:hypothetical protein